MQDQYRGKHVSDSFQAYTSTLQMISIMFSFVFAVLVAFVTSDPVMSSITGRNGQDIEINFAPVHLPISADINVLFLVLVALVISAMCLLTALVGFHATLIKVFVRWRIFFPEYRVRTFASFMMTLGMFSTGCVILLLLVWRHEYILACLCTFFMLSWIVLIIGMARDARLLRRSALEKKRFVGQRFGQRRGRAHFYRFRRSRDLGT